jgi:hypothetical protein
MIKFVRTGKDGKPLVGLGLSAANIQKLKEDKPILLDLKELGMEGQLFIFTGDTEQSMLNDLKEAGLLPVGANLIGDFNQ